MQVHPYLMFNGRCSEALDFYTQVLDATVTFRHTIAESPVAADFPAAAQNNIMHANLQIGDTQLMLCDGPPGQTIETMRGYSLTLALDDLAKAEQVFAQLADGGRIDMPFAPTFWAKGFGSLVDRFGVSWMINVEA
jgi:PhnB protein